MRVFVENLQFVGPHGVYEDERREGRRFRVDVSVDLDEVDATSTDDLADTIDYRGLADIVLEFGTGSSCQLIERLGQRICDAIFERYTPVSAVDLTIRKFATGVPGAPECVGVQLRRSRSAQH